MKTISVLGSTGSIGTQTLDVVEAYPDRFQVGALVANRHWELLAEQARKFRPRAVAIGDESFYPQLKDALSGCEVEVLAGEAGVIEVASRKDADIVLSALVGVAGLRPTVAALEAGKPIALANKETLVVGGELVTALAKKQNVPLLPVDSEHSAIFQSIRGRGLQAVKRIMLTASGGPFRTVPADKLAAMTAAEALQHPTWNMGAKITVDSSSLMNKGFEVLEAMHLFEVGLDQIDIWVHPQSIVHSMVEFWDGSVIAQMGPPDMRTPIQYALGYPDCLTHSWQTLSVQHCRSLTFEEPRWDDFPCLSYAFEAGRRGGTMPCCLNAANEVAVAAFLAGKITFGSIPKVLRQAMDQHTPLDSPSLEVLSQTDAEVRRLASEYVRQLAK
ncbi:1-deoxy-D-xylulose-5-phosphate reductoisomerase [bacterium]|nr:1-deoxy-D-xylulose-5-phosphate reductoisomerase [bacterium]